MTELALRAASLPDGVDWGQWRASGVVQVLVSGSTAQEQLRPVRDAGLAVGGCFPLDALGTDAGARFDEIVIFGLTTSPLDGALGARLGEATVSELDVWAAGVDADAARRYLDARISGAAPAELPASAAAVRLLLGADAEAVLAERSGRAGAAVDAAARSLGGKASLAVELDGPTFERPSLMAALPDSVSTILVKLDGSLLEIRRGAEAHRSAAGARAGAVLTVPSNGLPDPERLADALDVVEGLGTQRIVLETNPAWLRLGHRWTARASNRLRGRPGRSTSTSRRLEVEAP